VETASAASAARRDNNMGFLRSTRALLKARISGATIGEIAGRRQGARHPRSRRLRRRNPMLSSSSDRGVGRRQ
jgi:hypothetical protein